MPATYSQNSEDLFILNYFDNYRGTLLEIGANNGIDLSNSKLLIEHGWHAHLVEPGNTFADLQVCYSANPNVHIYNLGIGDRDDQVKFWESGSHVPDGLDQGLVSTTCFEETKRWPHVNFTEREVRLVKWDTFYKKLHVVFDFISIDAEGADWAILQQIDLKSVGCKALCIEHNSNDELLNLYKAYCVGYSLALKNAENAVFVSA